MSYKFATYSDLYGVEWFTGYKTHGDALIDTARMKENPVSKSDGILRFYSDIYLDDVQFEDGLNVDSGYAIENLTPAFKEGDRVMVVTGDSWDGLIGYVASRESIEKIYGPFPKAPKDNVFIEGINGGVASFKSEDLRLEKEDE